MKKTRVNKIYELIGRAVTFVAGYVAIGALSLQAIVFVVCNCCTTIR